MSVKARKRTKLEKRFMKSGRSVSSYAKAHDFDKGALFHVLAGKLKGVNPSKKGKTRAIILQLQKDGIWTEPLPWTVEAA